MGRGPSSKNADVQWETLFSLAVHQQKCFSSILQIVFLLSFGYTKSAQLQRISCFQSYRERAGKHTHTTNTQRPLTQEVSTPRENINTQNLNYVLWNVIPSSNSQISGRTWIRRRRRSRSIRRIRVPRRKKNQWRKKYTQNFLVLCLCGPPYSELIKTARSGTPV